MPSLDSESGCFVLKIVYDGAGEAGKTTTVQALAGLLGAEALSPDESQGRTLYFDWMEYRGGMYEGRPLRCQVVAVPGQSLFRERRLRLLRDADAAVFVVDSSAEGCERAAGHLGELRERLAAASPPARFLIQANKRDRDDALPVDVLRERLELPRAVTVTSTVASQATGIRETFVYAVRLALQRLGPLPDLFQLEEAHRDVEDPVALLAELQSLGLSLDGREPAGEPPAGAQPVDEQPAGVQPDKLPAGVQPDELPVDELPDTRQPRLPDAMVPIGHVWPPTTGRHLLLEASREDARPELESDGSWLATSPSWRYRSTADAVFPRREEGLRRLLALANWHSRHSSLLSPARALALAPDGASKVWRLWQLVAVEAPLGEELRRAESSEDRERIQQLLRAAFEWASAAQSAPWLLGCAELDSLSLVEHRALFATLAPTETIDTDDSGPRKAGPREAAARARLIRQIRQLAEAHGIPQPVDLDPPAGPST